VPGTGNVLGAWQRGTNIYAIRGTSTTSALLWRSSAGGWSTAGISYGISVYYQGLLNSVQSAQFTATLDTNGVLNVTAMASGTIFVGATLADNAGLTPIGATILSTLGTATGQVGQYQISVTPSIPVASETMLTLNPAAQLPIAGQVVVGA